MAKFQWVANAVTIAGLKEGVFFKAINEDETHYIIFININGNFRKLNEIMYDGHDGIFYFGHKNLGLTEISYSQLVDDIYGWTIKEVTLDDFHKLN